MASPNTDRLAPGPTWQDRFYGAVSEQFTHFGTLQLNGKEVPDPTGQYLNSSISQLVAGYTLNQRLAIQLNVPLIYRSFKRPEGFRIDRGTESGLGDISLVANLLLFHTESGGHREVSFDDPKSPRLEVHEPDFAFSASFIGGVKFPTGDSSRLKEEFHESEIDGAPESGIHGHDLTLGSGSYDGILGGQATLRYRNFFFEQGLQFTIRGDGAHQYHFANDLSWSGGPGYYFIRDSQRIVGCEAVFSGEYKSVDRFRGDPAEDTGITLLAAGPRFLFSLGRVSGEIGVEFPFLINNTSLQAVPDYRITGAISVSF
jgi:hypothetical protein